MIYRSGKGGVFRDKMQRGIVIDIQSKHLVVMTADGLFKKVPKQNKNVEIGDEISFSAKEVPRRVNWKVYLSGAVAAVLALFFLFPFFFNDPVHAHSHVYVEIKPGIEIGLNEKLEVVQVRPIDPEANVLLKDFDWNDKPVRKVVVDYLKQARKRGYLKKKDEVVLSAVNEKGSSTSTLNSIQTVINNDPNIGKKSMDLQVFAFAMPKEIKQKAEKTGLTPGKYGVWLLSKKEGKEIPVEEIAKSPISDLTENIDLNHPPTESEWIKIATEEEKNLSNPDQDSKTTQPKSRNNLLQNQDKQPTNRSSDTLDDSMKKDGNNILSPSKSEDKKNDESLQNQKEQGGEDKNSTSTGDWNGKTNHASP